MRGQRVSAYHEAGHAVATRLCGELVHGIHLARVGATITDRRDRQCKDALGLTETSGSTQPPEIVRSMIRDCPELRPSLCARAVNDVFVLGAGAVAEARIGRRSLISVWWGRFCQDDFSRSLMAFAPFIESQDDRSRAVSEVWGNGSTILGRGQNWKAVCAVAEALLASPDGYLDGDRADDLIDQALPNLPGCPLSEAIYRFVGPGPTPHPTVDLENALGISIRENGETQDALP